MSLEKSNEIMVCFLDVDTRRRAACDLVKGLCKHFEGPVTAILSHYVNVMLEVCGPLYNSVFCSGVDSEVYLVSTRRIQVIMIVIFQHSFIAKIQRTTGKQKMLLFSL